MKYFIHFLLISLISPILQAQHTGNIHYNQKKHAKKPNIPLPTPSLDYNSFHTPNPNEQYFFVEVNALANVIPQAYLAVFNVVQLGSSALEADSLMQKRVQGFIRSLSTLNIGRESVFIDMISQVPIFEYQAKKKLFSKNYQEIPKGIELQKNIHVRFEDGSILDRILALAAKHEIFDLVKVDYLIEDQAKVIKELRKKAIEYCNEQGQSYADLGINMDTLDRIFTETSGTIYPIHQYLKYEGFSSSTLNQRLKDSTDLKQIRKPQTYYYQGLPLDQYEIVLNPLVKEPAVQFVYNLRVRYQLKRPKAEVRTETVREKEFIILTPEGKTQTLDLQRINE